MNWIPISQPPELSSPAIVFDPTAVIKIFTAFYLPLPTTEKAAVFFDGGSPVFNVTHWMPWPKYPGETESGQEVEALGLLKESVDLIERAYRLNKDDMGFDVDADNFTAKYNEFKEKR